MKPKSRGAGIMISDYIDEHSGFLCLTDQEYERMKETNPSAKSLLVNFFWSMERTERVIVPEISL